ncbi:hypothetical protein VPH35_003909 [Triticum aestivum]
MPWPRIRAAVAGEHRSPPVLRPQLPDQVAPPPIYPFPATPTSPRRRARRETAMTAGFPSAAGQGLGGDRRGLGGVVLEHKLRRVVGYVTEETPEVLQGWFWSEVGCVSGEGLPCGERRWVLSAEKASGRTMDGAAGESWGRRRVRWMRMPPRFC